VPACTGNRSVVHYAEFAPGGAPLQVRMAISGIVQPPISLPDQPSRRSSGPDLM